MCISAGADVSHKICIWIKPYPKHTRCRTAMQNNMNPDIHYAPFICATLVSLSSDEEAELTKQKMTAEENQRKDG